MTEEEDYKPPRISQQVADNFAQAKQLLIQKDLADYHVEHEDLSAKEKVVEFKLARLRDNMLKEDPSLITGGHYSRLEKLLSCPLWKCLHMMPKPAIHHTHLTATADVAFLIKLTYYDEVFYSEKENMFFCSKKGCDKSGYMQVNKLRQYSKSTEEFDAELRDKILLRPTTTADHKIWEGFQYKFMLTNDLYNYAPFFEKILYHSSQNYIDEMVTVVEYRHIFGMVFDDDHRMLTIQEELSIFYRVLDNIQRIHPYFRMKIITCGLKIVGRSHIQSQLDAIVDAKKWIKDQGFKTDIVVGFDMVNEEDYNMPIDDFLDQILETKEKLGEDFQVYFHAGESYNKNNTELFDAVLLGTKRIGHGFNLIQYPELIKYVKDNNICVEACLVSNRILGYCTDLRCHPTRTLLNYGVKVSISPDDQGFFDAKGVTLDYLLAYIAWDLSLADLRQLCLNSIEYATVSEEHKETLKKFFNDKWSRFLAYVKGAY